MSEQETKSYILERGPGSPAEVSKPTTIIEKRDESDAVQEHPNGTNVGSNETGSGA